MTPTPRTEQFAATPRGLGTGYYQALDFARQLERENAQLLEAMAGVKADCEAELEFYKQGLQRIAKLFGIEHPLQLIAKAESDEETYVDILIKHIQSKLP